MILLYPYLCYNEVSYKGTSLYMDALFSYKTDLDILHWFFWIPQDMYRENFLVCWYILNHLNSHGFLLHIHQHLKAKDWLEKYFQRKYAPHPPNQTYCTAVTLKWRSMFQIMNYHCDVSLFRKNLTSRSWGIVNSRVVSERQKACMLESTFWCAKIVFLQTLPQFHYSV